MNRPKKRCRATISDVNFFIDIIKSNVSDNLSHTYKSNFLFETIEQSRMNIFFMLHSVRNEHEHEH